MIDLQVELVAVRVVFRTELSADQTVAMAKPPVNRRIQSIAPAKVIRQGHIVEISLDETGAVESRS